MTIITEILRVRRISQNDLDIWVERDWLLPIRTENEWQFEDEDIARIELICDLLHELKLHSDAVDVILPLMDQVYSLRQSLRAMTYAASELPADTRRQLLDSLADILKK